MYEPDTWGTRWRPLGRPSPGARLWFVSLRCSYHSRCSIDLGIACSRVRRGLPEKMEHLESIVSRQYTETGYTYPARKAIYNGANGTFELVHVVLVNAPTTTIGCFTMEGIVELAFRLAYRFSKMGLIHILCHQGFDFALLSM